MIVLHLINDASRKRGGAQKILSALVEAEKAAGWMSLVYSRLSIDAASDIANRVLGFFWVFKIVFHLFDEQPSVAVFHSRMYYPMVYFYRLCGVRTVFYCHANYEKYNIAFYLFRPDAYVYVSESVKSNVEHIFIPKRSLVNYNFLTIEGSEGEALKCQADFVYVGGLHEWKGVVALCQLLVKLPVDRKVTVAFFGDGPCYSAMSDILSNSKIDLDYIFMGYVKDPFKIIDKSSVVIIPSYQEGFGLVAIEAMYNGNPIIYSAIPALREILSEDDFSFGFSHGDEDTFFDAVNKSLSLNAVQIDQCRDFRIRRVLGNYSRKSFDSRYVNFVSSIF